MPTVDDLFTFSLEPVDPVSGSEPGRALLDDAKRRTGMIPNMYARMANAPVLLETYSDGYGRFRTESGFSPAEQEVVFLAVSLEHGCDYCVAAHSFIADKVSKVPTAVANAIRTHTVVPDVRLAALASFTQHLVATRGRPLRSEADAFLAAGFTETQILYIILAIAVKTISNYSNHMFDTPIDEVFAAHALQPVAHPASAG